MPLLFFMLCLAATPGSAGSCSMTPFIGCINTTYSRADEREITNDLGLLIIGAFAHHGDAFYRHEVERCESILQNDHKNFDARNDLGAAYTKLKMFKEAKAAFEENEQLHPGRYQTASNLGVMYKKEGEFDLAAEWIAKALEIKPGGHMGLGDYYLQMIRWRKEFTVNPEIKTNFLGVPYEDGPEATAKIANREYLITLIKNDMNFADAYIVLGDVLFVEGDYQAALRAYYRAEDLGEREYQQSERPDRYEFLRSGLVESRVNKIGDYWESLQQPGFVVERDYNHSLGRDQITGEILSARLWLKRFQQIEAERLAEGEDVSFATMKVAMADAGIEEPKITEAGYYEGTSSRVGSADCYSEWSVRGQL